MVIYFDGYLAIYPAVLLATEEDLTLAAGKTKMNL